MSAIMRPLIVPLLAATLLAGPALAQPGWDRAPDRLGWRGARDAGPAEQEGHVDADSFVAQDARATLGHGAIAIVPAPGSDADSGDQAAYEAAVVDQLVKAGYETATPDPQGGQVAEVRIVRDVLLPEEAPHRPVSGSGTFGVSNRGTFTALAINVDLSKPKKALISTRLEARVRDRATDRVLWEGHAEMATREGSDRWTDQAIATRLAAALFRDFPNGNPVGQD